MAKKRRKSRPKVPAAIFYINPKTNRRKRWRSGPPPKDTDGDLVRLFDSRNRKIRKLPKRNKRNVKLSIIRLPSADPNAAVNRAAIVRLARAKTWSLFWLRAGVIKPGEKEVIFIGTKVFQRPITTRIAGLMLRLLERRATKSGEAIIMIDMQRRPIFKPKKKKKK